MLTFVPIPKAAAGSLSSTNSEALAVDARRIDFEFIPGGMAAHDAAIPLGSSNLRCQERGGARGWNATRAEFKWTNSASVVRYRNSTACGSSNSGGVANSIALAIEMTAQIAQASLCCWSESWLDAGCRSELAGRIRRRKDVGVGIDLYRTGLKRRRRIRRDPVEMPERKRKLNSQRKKREPRAMLDVRSEPLHTEIRLASGGGVVSAAPTLQCNIAKTCGECQPWSIRVPAEFVWCV